MKKKGETSSVFPSSYGHQTNSMDISLGLVTDCQIEVKMYVPVRWQPAWY